MATLREDSINSALDNYDDEKKKAVSQKSNYNPMLINHIRRESELIYNELIGKGHSEFTARMYAEDYVKKSMGRLEKMVSEKSTSPEIKRKITIDETDDEISELTTSDIEEIDAELGNINKEAKDFAKGESTAITDTDRYKEKLIKDHGSWEDVPDIDKSIYEEARGIEQQQHEESITDLDMLFDPAIMESQERIIEKPEKTKRQENIEGMFLGNKAKRIKKAEERKAKRIAKREEKLAKIQENPNKPITKSQIRKEKELAKEQKNLNIPSQTVFDYSMELEQGFDGIGETQKGFNVDTPELDKYTFADNSTNKFVGPMAKGGLTTTPNASADAGMNMAGAADAAGAVGGALTSLTNLGIALTSKDKVPRSPFTTYATDALKKLDETKQFAGRVRSMQQQDLLLQEQGARRSARGSARGIGTFRAQELGIHIAGMGGRRAIDTDYYNRLEGIHGKEADVLLDRDRVRMGDEVRRQETIQKERDAYRSAISEAVSGVGTYAQQQAKMKNKERENKMKMDLGYFIGKYGPREDYKESIFG